MLGWGGVGMGWWRSLHMYTSIMSALTALQLYRNDCSCRKKNQSHQRTHLFQIVWPASNECRTNKLEWTKKAAQSFLEIWRTWFFHFFMTGVVNRPPANVALILFCLLYLFGKCPYIYIHAQRRVQTNNKDQAKAVTEVKETPKWLVKRVRRVEQIISFTTLQHGCSAGTNDDVVSVV